MFQSNSFLTITRAKRRKRKDRGKKRKKPTIQKPPELRVTHTGESKAKAVQPGPAAQSAPAWRSPSGGASRVQLPCFCPGDQQVFLSVLRQFPRTPEKVVHPLAEKQSLLRACLPPPLREHGCYVWSSQRLGTFEILQGAHWRIRHLSVHEVLLSPFSLWGRASGSSLSSAPALSPGGSS